MTTLPGKFQDIKTGDIFLAFRFDGDVFITVPQPKDWQKDWVSGIFDKLDFAKRFRVVK